MRPELTSALVRTSARRSAGALTLEPGRYVFLRSIGSHYDGDTGRMRGRLTVRANQG